MVDHDDPANLGSLEYLAVPTDPVLRAQRFDQYPEFAEVGPEHDTELKAMANVEKFRQQLRGGATTAFEVSPLVTRIERRIDLGCRESEAKTTEDGIQILTIRDANGMESFVFS